MHQGAVFMLLSQRNCWYLFLSLSCKYTITSVACMTCTANIHSPFSRQELWNIIPCTVCGLRQPQYRSWKGLPSAYQDQLSHYLSGFCDFFSNKGCCQLDETLISSKKVSIFGWILMQKKSVVFFISKQTCASNFD